MQPRTPSPAQLAALRVAFAMHRPSSSVDFVAAARSARCTPAQARRAWLVGWNDIAPLASEFSDERDVLVATLKANVVAHAVTVRAHALGAKLDKLEPAIDSLVERFGEDLAVAAMTPMQVADTLRAVVGAHRSVATIAKHGIELERLTNDQATSIVEHVSSSAAPIDLEAAKRDAEAMLRHVEREEAKQRLAAAKGNDDGSN